MVKIIRAGKVGSPGLLTKEQKAFLESDMTFMNIKELSVEFKRRFTRFSDGSLIASRSENTLNAFLKQQLKNKKHI